MAKAKVLNQERLAHAVATRGVDTLDDELQAARDAIMRRAYELFEGRGLGGRPVRRGGRVAGGQRQGGEDGDAEDRRTRGHGSLPNR